MPWSFTINNGCIGSSRMDAPQPVIANAACGSWGATGCCIGAPGARPTSAIGTPVKSVCPAAMDGVEGNIRSAADGMAGAASGPVGDAVVDHLLAGQRLMQRQRLRSADGAFELMVQSDGNLVVYRMPARHPVWSSDTYRAGKGGPFYLDMQEDGNLVLYQADRTRMWESNTFLPPSSLLQPAVARLQCDGHLVLCDATGRVCDGSFRNGF